MLTTLLRALLLVLLPAFFAAFFAVVYLFLTCRRSLRRTKEDQRKQQLSNNGTAAATTVVGFFHPRCSAGGGGERVLWKAIQALGELNEARSKDSDSGDGNNNGDGNDDGNSSKKKKNISVVIYTADKPTDTYKADLLAHIRDRFSISIPPSLPLSFLHLHIRPPSTRRRFLSMIMESVDTVLLAYAALHLCTPDIYFDTTGCAFTFIVAKLANCKVGAYVHYPTISTDMLTLVWERRPTYNNDAGIATSTLVTYVKLVYYAVFAAAYGYVGGLADLVMVNSSWTEGHIRYLWRRAPEIRVVFPPVDTESFEDVPLVLAEEEKEDGHAQKPREDWIVSIGQFRPEKDHALQIRSFARLLERREEDTRVLSKLSPSEEEGNTSEEMKNTITNDSSKGGVRLILIGSCRGEDDLQRVDDLKKLVRTLHITHSVDFVLNQPYPVLKDYLSRSSMGIHTMWNEHFGIGVVEMMAAGLVTIAHDSGGPRSDIIVRPWSSSSKEGGEGRTTGCLASTVEGYAEAMLEVLRRGPRSEETFEIRRNARESARRFSDGVFMDSFKKAMVESSLLD